MIFKRDEGRDEHIIEPDITSIVNIADAHMPGIGDVRQFGVRLHLQKFLPTLVPQHV